MSKTREDSHKADMHRPSWSGVGIWPAEAKLNSRAECTYIFFLAICGGPWLKVDGQEKSPGAAAVHQRSYRTLAPCIIPTGKSDPSNNRVSESSESCTHAKSNCSPAHQYRSPTGQILHRPGLIYSHTYYSFWATQTSSLQHFARDAEANNREEIQKLGGKILPVAFYDANVLAMGYNIVQSMVWFA